jgi:phosphotransferase system  glucose/maltose/N-acetylglucosamine-specific IIC component
MKELLYYFAATITQDDIGYHGASDASSLMSGILNTVYFWMGVTAVGFIVYGGFQYVLSSGEPGKIRKAKDTLLYAIIGVVVVLIAFVITRFIIDGVG